MINKNISGKYIVDELIGSGGTANVYKAHLIDEPKTVVAIKFLKEEYQSNAEYVRRFMREAQAGMTLVHPNIVKVLDTGADNGVNYIVFEYVSGLTLKDYIAKRKCFNAKVAVNIAGNILDAIGYAHNNNIIHRDVKPQNVMITTAGGIKLADFGIARVTTATTKSFSGTKVIGSVHYISPEQAAGKEITCQSDLYSVGIILYELLTGSLPYENTNEVSVALMHIKNKMEPPIERNPEISHAMNAVILKATAKDVDIRYKSAEEMKNDLLRALKEPDGTFADINEEDLDPDNQEKVKMIGNLNKGIFNTVVILGGVIAVMIIAFLIIRATYKPYVAVSSVIGKTVDEATAIFGDSLSIVVEYESSDKNPGYIISQDPVSGSRVQRGTKVTVTVSVGSERAVIPDLNGYILSDAIGILSEKGLGVKSVEYINNDDVEIGTIFSQQPAAGDEVDINSLITLQISGVPESVGIIPDVTDKNIDDAVSELNEAGFSRIRVRTIAESGTEEGHVISQKISSGLNIDINNIIELSVSGTHGNATCDCAYNITVDESGEAIVITFDTKKGYELVAYECTAAKGVHIASFTAYMDESGEYECIVYKANIEYKRSKCVFSTVNN